MLLGEYAHVPAGPAAGAAPVVAAEGGIRGHRAGQQPKGQRPIDHHAGALLHAVGKDFLLHAPVEHIEAILHDVHAADRLTFLDLLQGEVGDADGSHLALVYQPIQRVHGLVEGGIDVGPVDEQHVQVVGAKVLQALLHGGEDGHRPAVPAFGTVGITHAALGDDDNVLAPAAQGFAQHHLRLASAVGRRGVETIDAQVDGPVHGGIQLGTGHVAIGAAHLPAPEAERRNRHVSGSETSVFHSASLQIGPHAPAGEVECVGDRTGFASVNFPAGGR